MCLCVGIVHMRKDAYRVQRRMSPGPGVTCGCELPKMGAANNKYPNHCAISTSHLYRSFTHLMVCAFFQRFFFLNENLLVIS